MSLSLPLIGAALGMLAGLSLVPITRRSLSAALVRSGEAASATRPLQAPWHRAALILASGLLCGAVLLRTGGPAAEIPPLVLMVALIQLAYCDLTHFLLPRTMVNATTVAVALSAVAVAATTGSWHRLFLAGIGGAALFGVLLAINLMNPTWMAFGDVRLAPAIGTGLAWIDPRALFQGFLLANVLAAVVGLVLMGRQRGGRKTALPFGLYLALGSAAVIFFWS